MCTSAQTREHYNVRFPAGNSLAEVLPEAGLNHQSKFRAQQFVSGDRASPPNGVVGPPLEQNPQRNRQMTVIDNDRHAAGNPAPAPDRLLAALLKTSGDCIKIMDLDGNLQFMSEGGRSVMEVDDFSILRGRFWPNLWAGPMNRQAQDAIASARSGQSFRFRGPADTAKGTPKYWDVTVAPILGSDGAVAQILSISRDITTEWKVESELRDVIAREQIVGAELQHRIKNALTLVTAIANQTLRSAGSEQEKRTFLSRLSALGEAHDLVHAAQWSGTAVPEVVEKALAPHQPGGAMRIFTNGPSVTLSPKQAVALALSLHELATNAAKYGALSNTRGHVDVGWSTVDPNGEPTFRFTWTEHGGPPPAGEPLRKGFGTRLLERVLKSDFNGEVALRFPPEGFALELSTALENVG